MVARLLDNCLCGSFFHSLFLCVYVRFFSMFDFLQNPNSTTHILTQRQSYFQTQDGNACTRLNFISLHTVSTPKGPPFPLCGRKRKEKEKSIWKRILAQMLLSSPHWGDLVTSHSWACSSLNPTVSGPYICLSLFHQPMPLMTQFGLALPDFSIPSRTYLQCLPHTFKALTIGD